MKIASLIADFLYQHKTLHLQGIGSFVLDNSVFIEAESHKRNLDEIIAGIQFENNPDTKEDPNLIAFISSATDKMKALAAADLNSHLELARQIINIGKPFYFEGIGYLKKTAPNQYALIAEADITKIPKRQVHEDNTTKPPKKETTANYKSILYRHPKRLNIKKPILFLLAVAGIALAIWGGYSIYTRQKKSEAENPIVVKPEKKVIQTKPVIKEEDTTRTLSNSDSIKFILEIAQRQRALQRFNQLKTYNWNLKMETKDSNLFTLFLLLPVKPADTTAVLDSLSILYGKQVYIAQ